MLQRHRYELVPIEEEKDVDILEGNYRDYTDNRTVETGRRLNKRRLGALICGLAVCLTLVGTGSYALVTQVIYAKSPEESQKVAVASSVDRTVESVESAHIQAQEKKKAEEKAEEEQRRKEEEAKKAQEEAEAQALAEQQAQAEAEAQAQAEQNAVQQASYTAPTSAWNGSVLTPASGVNYGPSGKETYYNLDMSGVISIMRGMGNTDQYWVREDGCKMLGNYIMVAANLNVHPRGSLVETSLGTGIVCDTGGFAYGNPNQLDIATAW